jgi:hypothetical protein
MLWLASAFYLFLLGEALAFYGTVEVVVIVAVCAVFCAVLPYGALVLERTVVVAGVLACAFAMNKRRQGLEIERLREKLLEARRRRRRRANWSGCGSPAISTTGRCRASSACRCAWRSCAS